MPKIIVPMPDVNVSVMRPIVHSIVRDVIAWTGLNKDTTIMYPDEVEGVRQLGSSMAEESPNRFHNKTKVMIMAKETYDESTSLALQVMSPTGKSVFSATEVSTCIVPIYSKTELELTLQIYTRDKTVAKRWQDDIRMRVSAGSRENTHVIEYNYMIPEQYLNALKMIHGLREAQAGYDEDYERWMARCMTPRATVATDTAGNNGVVVVAERQARVLGWFEFNLPEEMEREDGPTHWVANVTYKAQYDKPIEMYMTYPVIVHNQVIPAKYRSFNAPVETHDIQKSYDNLTGYLSKFEADVLRFQLPGLGIQIPHWDEFVPTYTAPFTVTLFTALTALNDGDRKNMFNLNDLGERSLNSTVLKFILNSEAAFINRERESVFNLAVYSGTDLVDPARYRLDAEGNVKALLYLQMRETFRMRLSVYMDWRVLSAEAIDRLRQNAPAVLEILKFLAYAQTTTGQALGNKPVILDVSGLDPTKTIPRYKMDTIVANTGIGPDNKDRGGDGYLFVTVGTFFIQARPDAAPADPADYHPEEKRPL